MIHFLRRLIKPRYKTLNRIEIDAAKIAANFAYLQSRQPGAAIFPVLKSNAYGHGLKETCIILNQTEAKMVAVDSYPEAQIAYRYFRGRILILGEMPLDAYDYAKLSRTEFVVYNRETLRELASYGRRAKVHLFVNSGMNREGITDIGRFIADNREFLDRVEVSGLCSHYASADTDSALNAAQEERFLAALETLRAAGYSPRWIHLGNSAALLKESNPAFTAYRAGLALYGYNPLEGQNEGSGGLQPALEAFSTVVSIQEVGADESVSYNEDFKTAQPGRIAVIPFGYFEGLDRRLSNRAWLQVRSGEEFYCRIAGRVCMNLCCLDIGQHEVAPGTEVQIISSRPDDPNSIFELAEITGTIPYEILVKLQSGIRRVIINN